MQIQNPFQPFISKINNDLANWLAKQKQTKRYLEDYKNTLTYLNEDFSTNQKVLTDHGQNIHSKAKTIDDKVVIRMRSDLYVEMSQKQAIKTIKQLIELYKQKILVCQKQVAKIMTTMRQVEELMQQYNNLPTQ